MTGIDRRGLNREIGALVTAGQLRVEPRGDAAGDRASNLYTIIFDAEVSSQEATPIVSEDDTVSSQRATPGVVPRDDLTDQYRTDQRTLARRASRARVPFSQDSASQFETFWHAYPSRGPHSNPEKPAWLAFEAAIKRGIDPALIICGAENYAAYIRQSGTEPRYVAQAMTWLRQERWSGYQQPPELRPLRIGMN